MATNPLKTETRNTNAYEARDARLTLEKDLVITPETLRMLEEAMGALRHHKTIYTDWGFGAVDPMGRNMILNFYGPPGTGKTLAAEALAGTLQIPFIHIGISEIESKFVGETAKNISSAFNAAKESGALLFLTKQTPCLAQDFHQLHKALTTKSMQCAQHYSSNLKDLKGLLFLQPTSQRTMTARL